MTVHGDKSSLLDSLKIGHAPPAHKSRGVAYGLWFGGRWH